MDARFQTILKDFPLFEYLYAEVLAGDVDSIILDSLVRYFVKYIEFYQLSDDQIFAFYKSFIDEYMMDLREFESTRRYPVEIRGITKKSRIAYDISLICSTFLSSHRYQLMETLIREIKKREDGKVLIVGSGAGIEIELLQDQNREVTAYDTEIGLFIKEHFREASFYETKYEGYSDSYYDEILLIEILEHLHEPFTLLDNSLESLDVEGSIHFTTAINIPQFDHLFKFKLEDSNIEEWVKNNGLEIVYKKNIPHNYSYDVDAYNCYYIVKKKLATDLLI